MKPTREATRLSGTLVDANRRMLCEMVGDAAYRRALASLELEAREALEHATTLTWVSLEYVHELIGACAHQAGRDVYEFASEMAERSMQRSLRTVWRVLLRFTSDEMLLARVATFYRKSFDRGQIEANITAPGTAHCVVRGRPGMTRLSMVIFEVGVTTLLTLTGRAQVVASSSTTRDGMAMGITWSP